SPVRLAPTTLQLRRRSMPLRQLAWRSAAHRCGRLAKCESSETFLSRHGSVGFSREADAELGAWPPTRRGQSDSSTPASCGDAMVGWCAGRGAGDGGAVLVVGGGVVVVRAAGSSSACLRSSFPPQSLASVSWTGMSVLHLTLPKSLSTQILKVIARIP